ncbi:MAG: chemotaxis protein CheW [Gammaproteobacteria bacterium]|nr:chemotaxis protein CheW [Gammaproteobacteria bacterium]
MDNDQAAIALLLYRVGPVLCCAPADPVQTIIAPQKLTRPPGSNAARPGIFYHANHVVTVSELRHRFGIPEAEREQPGRLVITFLNDVFTAYWVDEIIEVIDIPKEGWGEAPAYLPKGIFSQTLLIDEKIYLYGQFSDFEKLPESDYLSQYFDRLGHPSMLEQRPDENETESSSDQTQAEKAPQDHKPQDIAQEDIRKENDTSLQTGSPDTITTSTEDPLHEEQEIISTDVQDEDTSHTATGTAETASIDNTDKLENSNPATDDIPDNVETEPDLSDQVNKSNDEGAREEPHRAEETTSTTQEGFLNPVPSVVPESERPPEKPPLPLKSLAASLTMFISLAAISGYYFLSQPDQEHAEAIKDNVTPAQNVPSSVTPKEKEQAPKTKNKTTTKVPRKKDDYRAEIKSDNDGITIVLHSPDPNPALKKEISKDSAAKKTLGKADRKTNSNKEEIIHIIVKGDTLWDIAAHYVNNPYKYPQLAKLSKIKNPDRIYPGNRVRILRHLNLGKNKSGTRHDR